MPDELLFTVHGSVATPAERLTLADAGLRERRDLQEWVIAHPEIIGPDIMIVTMEFDRWQSSDGKNSDRLDILGLHTSGELVVAELKRDRAPDTVEMQAIKYAAMVSRFTTETLAEQHAKFLTERGTPTDDEAAADLLTAFADLTSDALRRPRVVLLASEYPATTAATAVWLREMGIDITLMQYHAYRTGQEISISVSQLLPIPSIEDFTVSPRQAEVKAAEETRRRRQDVSTVAKIVRAELIGDDAQLTVRPYGINSELREVLDAWLDQDPRRRLATWRNDEKAPLRWHFDDADYSPTALAQLILREGAETPRTLRGTDWWIDDEGRSLVEIAASIEGERGAAYIHFWSELIERIREAGLDWSPSPPSTSSWINFKAAIPGSTWELSFSHRRVIRSGLYFWDDRARFEELRARRAEIEDRFGQQLEWETPDGRKFSRVALFGEGDITEVAAHETLMDWCIDTQRRLREAIDGVPALSR
jgi:hypothetical protein